jgi:hypothetical protein
VTIHLSVSQSRRLAVEMPVGNPFDGPLFGKKTMPVVAIAAAASSFAAGAAMMTAAGATMSSMIIGGAMAVGGALTIVGTVTGNAKLTKIGGILGMVGFGAGLVTQTLPGMANAAGAAAGTEAAANAGAADAAGQATGQSGAANAAGAGADVATSGVETFAVETPTASTMPVGGAAPRGMTDVQASAFAKQAAPNSLADVANHAPMATNTSALNQQTLDPGAMNVGTDAGGTMQASFSDAGFDAQNGFSPGWTGANSAQPIPPSDPSMLSKLQTWAKENPQMAKMAWDGIGGLASNLVMSDKDKAMMEAYRQQVVEAKRRALWADGRMA